MSFRHRGCPLVFGARASYEKSTLMAIRTIALTPSLEEYLMQVSVLEPAVLRELRLETAALSDAGMQIGPDQGRLLWWLAKLVSAKHCIEVGVFTGYSSLWIALAMPDDGVLIACDTDAQVTRIAERYWEAAGVSRRIRLEIQPAVVTLQGLISDGRSGSFDLAFIDADKESYDQYYEACLALLRSGGLLLVDNTLWHGKVTKSSTDAATSAIQALNRKISCDDRVMQCLLPIGDGLTLICKR
jgi:predicted O-methyltransferase YrrM